jgi:hypothetical protein
MRSVATRHSPTVAENLLLLYEYSIPYQQGRSHGNLDNGDASGEGTNLIAL